MDMAGTWIRKWVGPEGGFGLPLPLPLASRGKLSREANDNTCAGLIVVVPDDPTYARSDGDLCDIPRALNEPPLSQRCGGSTNPVVFSNSNTWSAFEKVDGAGGVEPGNPTAGVRFHQATALPPGSSSASSMQFEQGFSAILPATAPWRPTRPRTCSPAMNVSNRSATSVESGAGISPRSSSPTRDPGQSYLHRPTSR